MIEFVNKIAKPADKTLGIFTISHMICFRKACHETQSELTKFPFHWMVGERATARVATLEARSSYANVAQEPDRMLSEAHHERFSTFCRRSFSPLRDEDDQNVAAMMDASRWPFVVESLL